MMDKCGGGGGQREVRYQFAAMIAFPSGLTLFDFGFCRTLEIEDLFFFFWSSRPMIAVFEVLLDTAISLPKKFQAAWHGFLKWRQCLSYRSRVSSWLSQTQSMNKIHISHFRMLLLRSIKAHKILSRLMQTNCDCPQSLLYSSLRSKLKVLEVSRLVVDI